MFKLKAELKNETAEIFRIADGSFGRPHNRSFGDLSSSSHWMIYHQGNVVNLEIIHVFGSEQLQIKMSVDYMGDEAGLFPSSETSAWWKDLWYGFVLKVSKPWSEWTEDEIMERPLWCWQFVEAGGVPSDRIHAFMVMKSYEIPEDYEVKGYFRSWESRSAEKK